MATTFTKLRDGSWGLRGGNLVEGQVVTVSRKNGETSRETVGRVLWTGSDGMSIATIRSSQRATNHGAGRDGLHYERGVGLVCDECGDKVSRGTRCWETGAVH